MDNNVRNILHNLVNTASAAADEAKNVMQSAGKAVADKYDAAKVNMELSRMRAEQERVFADIGRTMFLMNSGCDAALADAEKSPQQVIDSLLVAADQAQQEIDRLNARLGELRSNQLCPACGRTCGEHDAFCSVCGAKLARACAPEPAQDACETDGVCETPEVGETADETPAE